MSQNGLKFVCVCVCVWERERERWRIQTQSEGGLLNSEPHFPLLLFLHQGLLPLQSWYTRRLLVWLDCPSDYNQTFRLRVSVYIILRRCPWCNGYRCRRHEFKSWTWLIALHIAHILDMTDCITHSTNTLGKGMNPNILPPAMGK